MLFSIENGHSRSKLFYIDGRNSRKFRGIYVEGLLDNSEEKQQRKVICHVNGLYFPWSRI